MKLIIPMAGRGKRLRPHSHVTPKPLLAVKGTSMVERIVDTFNHVLPHHLDEGVFVLGPDFGADVRRQLTDICRRHAMEPHFIVQEEPLGTAHAVGVTGAHMQGEGIVVYADTVFEMDPGVQLEGADVIAWVKEVEDPSRFGVAVREGARIVAFVEKPQELISKEALIGIYYVKDLTHLQAAIDHLFEHDIRGKGSEFYLTDAFDLMLKDGRVFKTATVNAWLDCGTLTALMDTTRHLLYGETHTPPPGAVESSVLIEPVYIGEGASVTNSVVGPYVSIEAGATVKDSILRHSIVFEGAHVENAVLKDSFIGAHASVSPAAAALNIGDHSVVE